MHVIKKIVDRDRELHRDRLNKTLSGLKDQIKAFKIEYMNENDACKIIQKRVKGMLTRKKFAVLLGEHRSVVKYAKNKINKYNKIKERVKA
jgi:hypothetical protein